MNPIQLLTEKIISAAKRARGSELKLQGECDAALREALAHFGLDYDPQVNQSLRRSFAASGRPDSLFGRVVLDYKAPGVLSNKAGLLAAQKQVADDYLTPIATSQGTFDPDEAAKLAGVLLDGQSICFVTFDGSGWRWAPLRPVHEQTITTLLQYYRSLYRKPLDPHLLSEDFGRDTNVAIACIRALADYLTHPTTRTSMFFKEWRRMFAQVSTYELAQLPALASWARKHHLPEDHDLSLLLYCLHTYYALIVKLLTAELITANRHFTFDSFFETLAHTPTRSAFKQELERLESGEVYRDLGITNFLEGDFFLWYLPHFDNALEKALREVIRVFLTYEPTTPKLNPSRCKDLLKNFYSGVVDEQLRHDLGEYYTPDWLAELVLDRVGYDGRVTAKVLDPTCGTGTFLVIALQRFLRQARQRNLTPNQIVDRAKQQFKGFDLNPLAVISARANYLLTIADQLGTYGGDIEIPIYLCDCINIPVERTITGLACLVYTLETELGPRQISLPKSLVDAGVIGRVLLTAETAIRSHTPVADFLSTIAVNPDFAPHVHGDERRVLEAFYTTIEDLEHNDWDQIWCRIIKNHFASQAMPDVDFIVGNPPWVRWSRLPTSYRQRCKEFCQYYNLVSGRGYAGGIESDISTVVTYSSVDNWLKPSGRLGFLITATVYKSDSARGFRLFELPDHTKLFPLTIDDLVALKPFPDAQNETSLITLEKAGPDDARREIYPAAGIPYTVWQGPRPDVASELRTVEREATLTALKAVPVADVGSPLFTGSDADVRAIRRFRGRSEHYLAESHKGTTTDLSRVFWVKVLAYDAQRGLAKIRTLSNQEMPAARSDGIVTTDGKWIEADVVYPLIRGRDIGRFCFETDGWHIIVPNHHYERVEEEDEFARRYPKTYEYFERNKSLLSRRSTYQRYQKHLPFYVIYDVGDYTFSRFKVVWMEQQNPAQFRAAVISIDRNAPTPNRIVVPDHKLYHLSTNNEQEAHFVCGVLNSTHLRRMLGGFLIGKQIGNSLFRYVGLPTYDARDPLHQQIAEIAKTAHTSRRGSTTTADLDQSIQRQLDDLVFKIF